MTRLTWQAVANRSAQERPLVMAHRGTPEERPENTLASFGLALEQGADALETDLRFTRDDVIVLMHDDTGARTTDSSAAIGGMTLAEYKRLRCHIAPMMAKEPVPEPPPGSPIEPPATLEELLQLTRGQVALALELKDDRFLNRADAQRLVDLLSRYDMLDSCTLVSFSLPRMLTFRPIAPMLRIGMITIKNPFPLFPTEFLGPYYPLLYANPFYVAWARRLNRIVCPLDIAPEPRLGFYRRLGFSILMTNHPGQTIAALNRVYSPAARTG